MTGSEDDVSQQGVVSKNWESFRHFLWNKERKEVAGRTASSWVQITLFFIVLYGSLIAFWLSLLYLAQLRLPEVEKGPLYTDYLSHRGPGLHIVPKPSVIGRDRQKIFYLSDKDAYFKETMEFLKKRKDSDFTDEEKWGPCSEGKLKQSWKDNKPCFYFYLNAIHNFVPEPVDDSKIVTMKCEAAKSHYEQYLDGSKSYPENGFNTTVFPWTYKMEWDKEAPLVAAQVKLTDQVQGSNEARIQCSVKAKNIHLDNEKPNIGMVDFRVKMEK